MRFFFGFKLTLAKSIFSLSENGLLFFNQSAECLGMGKKERGVFQMCGVCQEQKEGGKMLFGQTKMKQKKKKTKTKTKTRNHTDRLA
jgi:hypothetical protein